MVEPVLRIKTVFNVDAGNDFHTQCLDWCTDTPDCKLIHYNYNTKECHIYDQKCDLTKAPIISSNFDVYVKKTGKHRL